VRGESVERPAALVGRSDGPGRPLERPAGVARVLLEPESDSAVARRKGHQNPGLGARAQQQMPRDGPLAQEVVDVERVVDLEVELRAGRGRAWLLRCRGACASKERHARDQGRSRAQHRPCVQKYPPSRAALPSAAIYYVRMSPMTLTRRDF